MLYLTINGKKETFDEKEFPSALSELLEKLKLETVPVVAEVNGEVVSCDRFASLTLANGQNIELVKFVGGG
jgi:sulfur carrier protein